MFDPFMASALALLRQQDLLEEAARARLVREAQLATQVETRRRERARRRELLIEIDAARLTRPAPGFGVRPVLARALRAVAEWLEGSTADLRDAGMGVAR